MGLNESDNSKRKIYLNIVGGEIARRFTEHQFEGDKQITTTRDIKDDDGNVTKTIIERTYKSISGVITNADIDKSGGYGAMLVFTIMSDGEEYTLSVTLDSGYGRAILKKLPNVNADKEIEFTPFNFDSQDQMNKNGDPKKIVGVNLFQKDCGWEKDKVPYKWTAESPGNLPKWKQSETTGKWDNTEELEFLGQHFKQWAKGVGGVVPASQEAPDAGDPNDVLSQEIAHAESKEIPDLNESEVSDNQDDTNDLPF